MPVKKTIKRLILVALSLLSPSALSADTRWSSSAKDFGESRSDFILREVERRPQSSVLQLDIKQIGGSVGASMITACMMIRLAEERGGYRYLVKLDKRATNPGQMLVGFSHQPNPAPQSIDPELPASTPVLDLDTFGPEFSKSCRTPKSPKNKVR